MHHLVTEWVTLPASFTCPALDPVLALLSTWSSLLGICFPVKQTELLEGAGRSLALGSEPGGTRTDWKHEGHPSILPWCMA